MRRQERMATGRSNAVRSLVSERDVFELADLDELEAEAGGGDHAAFEAAGSADEEDFGLVALDQGAGDGEGGDDVAAGAAAGDQDAGVGQDGSLRIDLNCAGPSAMRLDELAKSTLLD